MLPWQSGTCWFGNPWQDPKAPLKFFCDFLFSQFGDREGKGYLLVAAYVSHPQIFSAKKEELFKYSESQVGPLGRLNIPNMSMSLWRILESLFCPTAKHKPQPQEEEQRKNRRGNPWLTFCWTLSLPQVSLVVGHLRFSVQARISKCQWKKSPFL